MPAGDSVARDHRSQAVAWLGRTDDIYRRQRPKTPDPHLVSYFLVVDRDSEQVLLCDHRAAGMWLPTGGHVEPGEHPVDTVRRECREELGIDARFARRQGVRPFFLTVTETTGRPDTRHTDVSPGFALAGRVGIALEPDDREFRSVRWWSREQIAAQNPDRFDPHLGRAIDVLFRG